MEELLILLITKFDWVQRFSKSVEVLILPGVPDFDSFHPFFTPWPKSARYESMG